MAKAKKLPSGKWRVLMYDQTGADGKRKYKSFTADTKSEAERMANVWKFGLRLPESNLTVVQAMTVYINSKAAVLSPASIYSYQWYTKMVSKTSIANVKICNLTTSKVQNWISEMSKCYAPQTTHICYEIFLCDVRQQEPTMSFKVSFPRKERRIYHTPTEEDIHRLISTSSPRLHLAILLCVGGNGALRRGEICAIKQSDINRENNTIYIHAAMVINGNGKYEYHSSPKTDASIRLVSYAPEIIAQIPAGKPGDFVVNANPSTITQDFLKMKKQLGLNFRFHDLRAYSASIMLSMGVPVRYIEQSCGWTPGSMALRQIYSRVLEDEEPKYRSEVTNRMKTIVKCNTNATQ